MLAGCASYVSKYSVVLGGPSLRDGAGPGTAGPHLIYESLFYQKLISNFIISKNYL